MAEPLSREEGAALLALARAAIRDAVDGSRCVDDLVRRLEISPALRVPRGVFVTLRTPVAGKKRGELRGCIGTLLATLPLYRNVIATAPKSALDDPRFAPLSSDEVEAQTIEVSALTPLEPVGSVEEIVCGRDGVQLTFQGRQAVFLPQVAVEQGWTTPQLLRHLALKARLAPDAWRKADLKIFRAEVFEEAGSSE